MARTLRLRGACWAALARARSDEQLFSLVCAALVEIGGYAGASVHTDRVRRQRGAPLGAAGSEDEGLPGTTLALQHEGAWLGALTIRAAVGVTLDEDELAALQGLAQEVAFGLSMLRERHARTAADEALRLAEMRLREAQHHAHIGSWLYVPGGRLLWSDETWELFKLPRHLPASFDAAASRVHPDDLSGPRRDSFMVALASGARELRMEYRVIWPDGQVRTHLAIGTLHRAHDGAVIDALGTVQDITELKEATVKAERAAARLALLADASRAFAENALDGRRVLDELARRLSTIADSCVIRLLSADGRTLELTEVTARDPELHAAIQEYEGRRPLQTDDPRPEIQALLRGESTLLLRQRDGTTAHSDPLDTWPLHERFPLEGVLLVPLRAHGTVIGGAGLVRLRGAGPFSSDDLALAQDLADRASLALHNACLYEKAEGELAERRRAELQSARLAMVIEQATEMVVVTDEHELIQYVNRAFETVTGYRRDEVLGKHPSFLRGGEGDESAFLAMRAAVAQGETWRGRLLSRRKDGTTFAEDAIVAPFRDERGSIAGYYRLKRDITRDLSLQEQLLQAQKMEGLGRLAGGVAHDFNNLLSVILGCAHFALEAVEEGDPMRADLLDIQHAGERAATLTRQLLAFSRRQAMRAEPLDVNLVVQDMEKLLRRVIGEDVTLSLELAPRLGIIKSDPGQLEQVLMNLAVNARDAMPAGGTLRIDTGEVELDERGVADLGGLAPGRFVRIRVTDSGAGMDAATLARIFEPFFTTKGPGKGTGLGLSTVFGIITQSGGAIRVESAPGHGTSFHLFLPCIRAELAAPPPPRAPARARGGETLLVVEDDEAVRRVARRILERAGYQVLAAASAAEGLELCRLQGAAVALVLSDVVMPAMSGPAFLVQARALCPRVRFLFMSGYTSDALEQHGIVAGQVDVLDKPLTQEDLLRRVRDALDSPAPAAAEAEAGGVG